VCLFWRIFLLNAACSSPPRLAALGAGDPPCLSAQEAERHQTIRLHDGFRCLSDRGPAADTSVNWIASRTWFGGGFMLPESGRAAARMACAVCAPSRESRVKLDRATEVEVVRLLEGDVQETEVLQLLCSAKRSHIERPQSTVGRQL